MVADNGTPVRGQGKPHHVEMLCRPRSGGTYVRGKVWHPDHRTIYLDGWHKVLHSTEIVPKSPAEERDQADQREALFLMKYVD